MGSTFRSTAGKFGQFLDALPKAKGDLGDAG
jgi:hypothetical protein